MAFVVSWKCAAILQIASVGTKPTMARIPVRMQRLTIRTLAKRKDRFPIKFWETVFVVFYNLAFRKSYPQGPLEASAGLPFAALYGAIH
jgi:hypothetical protein